MNLKDLGNNRKSFDGSDDVFEGQNRIKWMAKRIGLIFGFNSEPYSLAEFFASADSQTKFIQDFAAIWKKIMNLDWVDLA